MTVGNLVWFALRGSDPDFLANTGGLAAGIGIFPTTVGCAAACEEHGGGIGLPCKLGDFLPVIGVELRYGCASEIRRPRYPDVAQAVGIQHPGNGVAVG